MDAHTQMCLTIFGVFTTLLVIFIYFIDKSVKKDNQELAQHKMIMGARLEEEKSKPMFKLVFKDATTLEMHESALCVPYIWSYSREGIVSSKTVAEYNLKNGFEKGYLTNVLGVSIPMHNILNAKVVQQEEK
jgi:hypothetical protein